MSLDTDVRQLPALEATRDLVVPASVERTLDNGLTIIAVERRSVPLVEVRLRIPFGSSRLDPAALACGSLLSQTLFSGTDTMSTVDIAAALQSVGGGLSASVDVDRLLVSGNGLASGLDRILGLLGDVLRGAAFPDSEVTTERARLVDRIQIAKSQPSHLVRVAFLRRIYGEHPYAVQTAEIADLRELGTDQLVALHQARVRATGATLVIVGDIDPVATLDLAEAALSSWGGGAATADVPPTPPLAPGPVTLVNREGAVQSSMRVALPAVGRTHPDHAALQLANLLVGGYFSSRWVENIREQKGYSYSPHSRVDHLLAGSVLVLSADVGTDVTAPALLETWYELGRVATVAPPEEEVEQARQYALGSLLLGMSTQSGLASLASVYAGYGLRLEFLAEHASRLAGATRDDVARIAATYLAPANAVTVVLGDAGVIGGPLGVLGPVERASA